MRSEFGIDFAVCEMASFDNTALDVFERFQLRAESTSLHTDMEYAIHEGEVNVPRIHPFSLGGDLVRSSDDDHLALTTSRPGRLSDIHWEYQPTTPLGSDDVEIEVYSVGLNQRDIFVATGSIEVSYLDFGQEAVGIIRRVGHGVKDLKIHDRVMALGQGTLASVIVRSEALCVRLSEDLTFNDAAHLSLIYTTAIYALSHVARLTKGRSILIQRGATRIGIAAIQIAHFLEATVFATADDENEAAHLVHNLHVPRSQIYLTSDPKFPESVLESTNALGVDIVLNSLPGELGHASWVCIAEFGVVIETERLGINEKQNITAIRPNCSYSLVDIGRIQESKPELIKEILTDTLKLLANGTIRLIQPPKVFDVSHIQNAFSELQVSPESNVVVQLRKSDGTGFLIENAVKRSITPQFDCSASYLLIGGLGGLGRCVSTWMVEHGARNLIFLSRSAGKGPGDKAFVNELVTMGCEVQLVQGSVSDPEVVDRAIKAAIAPLKGILQMSMVLRDVAFSKMSWEDWELATKPKTIGTWNLHNATLAAGIALDFFTLFSSISGVIGQPGQANYAGANTFLNAFCNYRQQQGLAASVIDFGPIDGVGVFSQKDHLLRQLKSAEFYCIGGKEVLDGLVVATAPASTMTRSAFLLGFDSTLSLDSDKNRLVWRNDPRMAVYHNRKSTGSAGVASGSDGLKGFLASARGDPSIMETPEAVEILAREISLKVLSLLSKADEEVNTNLGLADLGMDSLVAIEMRMWWNQTFRFDISVLEMMGKGTLDVLAKHAADGIRKSLK